MYDDILLPIDQGTLSKQAAKHAFKLASDQNATIHIIHTLTPFEPAKNKTATPEDSPLYENAQELINEYKTLAQQHNLEPTTKIIIGHPHTAVVDYEQQINPDLIIMGTHARKGIQRIVIGSITEDIIRNADTPVLTVN